MTLSSNNLLGKLLLSKPNLSSTVGGPNLG